MKWIKKLIDDAKHVHREQKKAKLRCELMNRCEVKVADTMEVDASVINAQNPIIAGERVQFADNMKICYTCHATYLDGIQVGPKSDYDIWFHKGKKDIDLKVIEAFVEIELCNSSEELGKYLTDDRKPVREWSKRRMDIVDGR